MKRNLTTKMIISFLLVVVVAMGGLAISINEIIQIKNNIEFIKNEGLINLERVNMLAYNSLDKVSLVRGYFLTDEQFLLELYEKEKQDNRINEDNLIQTARTSDEKELAQKLKDADAIYTSIVDSKIIPLIKSGKRDEVLAVMKGELTSATRDLISITEKYKEVSNKNIEENFQESIKDATNAIFVSLISAIVAIVMGLLIGYYSAKRISKPINEISAVAEKVAAGNLTISVDIHRNDEIGGLAKSFNTMIHHLQDLIKNIGNNAKYVAASSEELTASAQKSAQAIGKVVKCIAGSAEGAKEQLKNTKYTSNIVETISANIEQISANIQEIDDNSSRTAEKAEEGGNALNRAVGQMEQIEKTVDATAEVVSELGQRSQEIGQIIETISGIAGQTNLLALNAAIEAARAGEQGRGFAVVAEEVRKLAEQSQEATKKISQLVQEIQSGTSHAVTAMTDGIREVKIGASVVNEAGNTFKEIVIMVSHVSQQINDVSNEVKAVAKGSEDIVSSVKYIDQLSQQTFEEAETVSAATEEQSSSIDEIAFSSKSLAKLSENLQSSISKFKI